jgi:hypothetical protein
MMKWLIEFFVKRLDGWKSIISYILLQIPWIVEHPMLLNAAEEWIADPQNPTKIGNLLLQIFLALGLVHKGFKEIKK